MNGYDIQEYEHLKKTLTTFNISLSTKGDAIILKYGKEYLGNFATLTEAHQFAMGFDLGLSKSKYIKVKK